MITDRQVNTNVVKHKKVDLGKVSFSPSCMAIRVVQVILIAHRVVKVSAGGTRIDHCHHARGKSK
jgi:hypothetical protein